MPSSHIDYSLYLVTGRELLPPGREYFQHLEEVVYLSLRSRRHGVKMP